ncbi:MAG: response regulator [Solirubrobacterales bacterium]
MEQIKVLIVDDNQQNRENIARILAMEQGIQVVGDAESGDLAIKKTQQLEPNIIVMDLDMPGMDGVTATEKITLVNPDIGVIIMSETSELQYLKKAMFAGARDYLVKPFNADELVDTIKRTYQIEQQRMASIEASSGEKKKSVMKNPQAILVFGTKGGSGKTSIAVNLAIQLYQITNRKVVLIDLDLQFGDVAIFTNLNPKRSIAELVQEASKMDINLMENYLMPHPSGIKVLPGPLKPEDSELVTGEHIMDILSLLRQHYDYIVIDTPPVFQDATLSAMDMASRILLVVSMDIPTIKNTRLTLHLLETLNQKAKCRLVLNRASDKFGVNVSEVEQTLDFPISFQVPSDGKVAVPAANSGNPFVVSEPNSALSQAIEQIAETIMKEAEPGAIPIKRHGAVKAGPLGALMNRFSAKK